MTSPRRSAPGFSFSDVTFPFTALVHLIRTSGQDISVGTFRRFFTAKYGNKERIKSISAALGIDPIILQRLAHTADGPYKAVSDGTLLIIRDFDLFVKCSADFGHRGVGTPELHFKCFPYDPFSAMPERYGECPFGKWEDLKERYPYLLSKDRFPEQIPIMEQIIDDYMEQYIGKSEEIGVITRELLWNVFTYTTSGVMPSEKTAALFKENEDNLAEFDYTVRLGGSNIPYEWSDSLATRIRNLVEWNTGVVEDRIANIDKCPHQADVLTDNVVNHPYDIKELEGQMRGNFSFGLNNVHCAVSGALNFNGLNDDKVYDYLMEDPEQNIELIIREALRLYTAIPSTRTIQENDDLVIEGKKIEPGTVMMLSTYAVNTDPLSWENHLLFDPARHKNAVDIGFMTSKGFAPFGPKVDDHPHGGRGCTGGYYAVHCIRTVLTKLLRDYKMTRSGSGYFDFQSNCGGCRYKGQCHVTIEKR